MNKTKNEITLYRFYTIFDYHVEYFQHLAYYFDNHKAVFRRQFQDASLDPSLWPYPELTDDVRKELADLKSPDRYNYN